MTMQKQKLKNKKEHTNSWCLKFEEIDEVLRRHWHEAAVGIIGSAGMSHILKIGKTWLFPLFKCHLFYTQAADYGSCSSS